MVLSPPVEGAKCSIKGVTPSPLKQIVAMLLLTENKLEGVSLSIVQAKRR